MLWRYGDTNPVMAAVNPYTVIEIGDLVYLDTDNVKPMFWTTMMTPEQLKKKFLGVAMQRSRRGENDPIRVATTGVFEFDCLNDTYELGDLIGIAGKQDVIRTSRERAIGRVARRAPVKTSKVLVAIQSTVMVGGV
jgi:hypothetical protein